MTTYIVGTRSFSTIEDAIDFANRVDFGFIAICVDGLIVAEYEV